MTSNQHPSSVANLDIADQLASRIRRAVDDYTDSCSQTADATLDVERIVVFGSYATDDATPPSSDLDVLLGIQYDASLTRSHYGELLKYTASAVETSADTILSGAPGISTLDVIAVPTMEARQKLQRLGEQQDECFYDLDDQEFSPIFTDFSEYDIPDPDDRPAQPPQRPSRIR